MMRVVDIDPTATGEPAVAVPVLHTTDPVRYARACRARAVVLELEGHTEEAQQLRDLADTTQENRT